MSTGRATPVRRETATPEQQQVWDDIVASRGDPSTLVGEDGALVGPFNLMVASPTLGGRVAALGEAVRFSSALDKRLQELAIITVGARWRANFEWFAHSRLAALAGVSAEVISAIGEGREPTFERDDEAIVHRLASELVSTGRVGADNFEAAKELLGETALIDLVTTVGYYSLVSLTLNAFQVPLPAGHEPPWPD